MHSSLLGTTHIHWTSLELPHVTGLLHVMCPQSHSLEQSESHCGATCLHPPRECWDRNPCHPWAPMWGHRVLHVSGTDFCLATTIHIPEASAPQHEDAARRWVGGEAETLEPRLKKD